MIRDPASVAYVQNIVGRVFQRFEGMPGSNFRQQFWEEAVWKPQITPKLARLGRACLSAKGG